MGELLLGMMSGETQHMMGPSADPEGMPQGRNYNTTIDQIQKMDKSYLETERSTDPSSDVCCSSHQYGTL